LGDGAGNFGTPTTFTVGTSPRRIVKADFNGDGKIDLATANYASSNVSILLGNGMGGFAVSNFTSGVGPVDLKVADFNLDGKTDVATANLDASTISVLLNNGAGGLGAPTHAAIGGSGISAIATGDLNNDGKDDLVTANTSSNNLSIFFGNGTGGFAAPTFKSIVQPTYVAVGRLNSDGNLDLVTTSNLLNITRMLGDGAGGFTSLTPHGNGREFVTISDVDQDGKADVLVVNNSMIRVLYGDGTGQLTNSRDAIVGAESRAAVVADFNRDGLMDLAATSIVNLSVSVSLGTSARGFRSPAIVGSEWPSFLVVADFNNDGRDDVVSMDSTGGIDTNLRIDNGANDNGALASATALPLGGDGAEVLVAGDFNNDGRLDIAAPSVTGSSFGIIYVGLNNGTMDPFDFNTYSTGFISTSLAAGDFNHDNKLDLAAASDSGVRILTGNGLGGFALTASYTITGATPLMITKGDFNNDGHLDLVTANTGTSLSMLLGDGAGGFGSPTTMQNVFAPLSTPNHTQPMTTGDFNLDGKLDLAIAPNPLQQGSVLLGTGTGGFLPAINLYLYNIPRSIRTSDFNFDGKPDLAVMMRTSAEVSILLGNGTGNFSLPINYPVAWGGAFGLGDFNRDGRTDFAVYALGLRLVYNITTCARGGQTTDFDGDGITDLSVFRPSTGTWHILYSSNNSYHPVQFGMNGDIPVPGDYDNDGKTDVAVFRPGAGTWYYLRSTDGAFAYQQFGTNGDIPVPGDYDGDGITNFAVFRPSTGYWYTSLNPATNYGAVLWGQNGDVPVPADYDGDGRMDIAVFRPSTANWYLQQSLQGYREQRFGISTDVPVPADYDGDGRANFAVFRPGTGFWYTSLNPATNYGAVQFGVNGDVPVPGFYDGDGKADVAVFRAGDWFIRQSMHNATTQFHFGSAGDVPLPAAP
jgi:hypothetical protein